MCVCDPWPNQILFFLYLTHFMYSLVHKTVFECLLWTGYYNWHLGWIREYSYHQGAQIKRRDVYVSKYIQYAVSAKIMVHFVGFAVTKERAITLLRMKGSMEQAWNCYRSGFLAFLINGNWSEARQEIQARLYWDPFCAGGSKNKQQFPLLACSLRGNELVPYVRWGYVQVQGSGWNDGSGCLLPFWWCCVQGSCAVPCFCSRLFRSGRWSFWSLFFFWILFYLFFYTVGSS